MEVVLKNAVKFLGLSLPQAAALVSANPAKVLGVDHQRGRIEKGFLADFCLLYKDFAVNACYIGGELAFSRNLKALTRSPTT
jgi:N-acetylglucosamine-6-phosphate deacetylase